MKVLILTKFEYLEWMSPITHGYDVHYVTTPNYLESGSEFQEPYDVGISFMWTRKVPAREVNTHTWINFHPAPLPEYKGRNLCYHAIMNGEKEFGATLHYMDENFDTGNIIHVYRFLIYPSDTAGDVSRKAIQSCKLLFETMFPDILAGKEFESVPNVGGKYYEKEPIHPYVIVDELTEKQIRAIYYPPHFPKIRIGNMDYRIVEEEE